MTQDKAIQFLNENATVKEWLEQRPPNTQEAYGRALLRFCIFTCIEPEEFQQLNRIEARDLVWNFVKDLKKESNSSARIVMAALKSFYRNHDGERLPFDSSRGGKHFIGQRRKKAAIEHIPSNEEVYLISDHCISLRDKCIVLVLFQSGIRVNSLTRLTYGMVKQQLKNGTIPLHLRITDGIDTKLRRNRVGFYDTFLNLEAIDMIRKYCEENHQESEDDDLLFPARTGKRLWTSNIRINVKKSMKRAGLDETSMWTHSLRKAFKRQVRNANVGHDYAELLMGHILPGAQENYVVRNEIIGELREAYMKVDLSREGRRSRDYADLSIKVKTLKSERETLENIITRQSMEVSELKEQVEKTEGVGSYIDELYGMMDKMKKRIVELEKQ